MNKIFKSVLFLLIFAIFLAPCTVYAKFSDDDLITQIESVNMLAAIGVINGYTDGAFRPEDPISRAEVAKILSIVLNGGSDPADLSEPDFTVFSDIRGHWAEKYINYIASLGIVSGYGSGHFGPADTITGQQLSKMLLVSLNYDPEIERLEGADWASYTDTLAQSAGLYNGLPSDFISSDVLSRDTASRMICNALYANRVIYNRDSVLGVTAYAKPGSSIMENSFNAHVVTGVVVANMYGAITPEALSFAKSRNMDGTVLLDAALLDGGTDIIAFNYDPDNVVLGTVVTAVINRKNNEAYGVIDAGISNLYTISETADYTKTKHLLSQQGLALNETPQWLNYSPNGTYSENKAGYITSFADFDGDGTVDVAITTAPYVARYEGNGVISFKENTTPPAFRSIIFRDTNIKPGTPVLCNIYSGVNYVSSCGILTGLLISISADLENLNVGGEIFLNSALTGASNIAECQIIMSDVVVVYLDDCGYVVYTEPYSLY